MTQTATRYQEQKEARIEWAMDHLTIDTDVFGTFALVPSTSGTTDLYSVSINESGAVPFAEKCRCPGNRDYGHVCVHMIATNRFFERIHRLMHPIVVEVTTPVAEVMADNDTAMRVSEQSELVANDKTYAQAVQERAEEVGYIGDPRIETVETHPHGYGCCGHIVKPEHDGQLCGACACK